MKSTIHLLDRTGDTRTELDLSDPESKAQAEKIIANALKSGGSVFTGKTADAPLSRVGGADQLQEHTVVVPRVVGG